MLRQEINTKRERKNKNLRLEHWKNIFLCSEKNFPSISIECVEILWSARFSNCSRSWTILGIIHERIQKINKESHIFHCNFRHYCKITHYYLCFRFDGPPQGRKCKPHRSCCEFTLVLSSVRFLQHFQPEDRE